MSIAALIQAAEYIERRDRGDLDFLCLNCQWSATTRTRQHGSRLFLPCYNQLILTEWQCTLLQKLSTDTRPLCPFTKSRAPAADDPRRRNRRAAGECPAGVVLVQ